MKIRASLLIPIALLFAGVTAPGAQAADTPPKAVVFNLTLTPLVQPDRFFFQANAGPYLKDLTWTGWGDAETTGTGRYIRDCAVGPCGAPGENIQDHPATFVLSNLGPCPRIGKDTQVYRTGRVSIDRDGKVETTTLGLGDDLCAKLPTRRAAVKGTIRYVKRTLHVTPRTVVCRDPDEQFYTCTARYTKRGKAHKRAYWVGQTVAGRLTVNPRD